LPSRRTASPTSSAALDERISPAKRREAEEELARARVEAPAPWP
jgi:hypothetical protein